MSVSNRRRSARQHGYCLNCLARSHSIEQCTSVDLCKRCGGEHHTLLHLPVLQRIRVKDLQHREKTSAGLQHRNRQSQAKKSINRQGGQKPQQRQNSSTNKSYPSSPTTNTRRYIEDALKALTRLQESL